MLSKLRVKYKKTFALGVFILLCLFGIALANLTSHTEALVDALLLALDSDADGAINDETWYGLLVTNGDSHDHSGGDGAQIDHGGLAGLTDDDHNGIYYSEAEVDAALALKIDIGVDPDIDVLYGWDDSAGTPVHITIGTGLSLTGTTLTATASATAMDDIAVPDAALSLNLGAYQHLWDTNVDTSAFRVGLDASYFEIVNSGGSDVIVRLVGSNITANLGTFTVATDSTHMRGGTSADDDWYQDVYDVDGTAYVHMLTGKAGNEPYLYLGPQANSWRVDQTGAMTRVGTASMSTVEVDRIPITAFTDGASPPAAAAVVSSSDGAFNCRAFDGASNEDVLFTWKAPADIDATQGIKFSVSGVVGSATAPANTEVVAFSLAGVSIGNSDAAGSVGTAQTSSLTADATYAQYDSLDTAFSSAITVTNLAAGETVSFELIRLATTTDTYAQDFHPHTVLIKYVRLHNASF